jgi:drug/metabolite transporter (DMT)-like permease
VVILYIFLWASAFVPSRIVSVSAPPLWILAIRFTIAGGALLIGARLAGLRFPRPRQLLPLALLGLCGNTLYLGLTYLALRHLSSGMGAIVASTNPLLLALAAPSLLGEPLTPRKLVGMVLGFSGVLIAMHTRASTASARPVDVLLAFLGSRRVRCFDNHLQANDRSAAPAHGERRAALFGGAALRAVGAGAARVAGG